MCGIHGFAWKDADDSVGRMVSAAKHRGPDGSGTWGDSRLTLGHNLLAVTGEPDAATQPWVHPSGHVLVFNGEAYNHRDLRVGLKHRFKTDTDTETLAAGLAEQGPRFLERVDGMFALAWYCPHTRTLTLARDANGARPLYAGFLNDRPCFSSEIRSLLALGFPRRVCREAFRHYYHAGLVAGPLTMFEGVRRLVPGQVVSWNLDTRETEEWNLNAAPVAPVRLSGDELLETLAAKLRQAVRLTLHGRRRTGLLLSGGMDSGAVAYELARLSKDVRTFSTRFDLPHGRCRHNEDADCAAELAALYGTRHTEVAVNEELWVDGFEKAVLAMEEPRQGKSYGAYFHTFRQMRKAGVVVTLSGDGGDELLMGYKHQRDADWAARFAALQAGHRELPDPALRISPAQQWDYLTSWLPGRLTGDRINDFMYVECMHTLAEDFLVRNDKLGAWFGMEARFPMMCRLFRDFCRGIPGQTKARPYLSSPKWDVNNKSLLRQAYTGKLPLWMTARGKTGWRAPTDDWIIGSVSNPAKDGPVRQYVREALTDPRVRELFGLTDDTVENRYLNNRDLIGPPKPSGKTGQGVGMASQKELFAVLTFAAWLKTFDMQLW